MSMIPLPPPGTICQTAALLEMIRRRGGRRFLEVGCGCGDLSLVLCRHGFSGTGIDLSPAAIDLARAKLEPFVGDGRMRLLHGDIMQRSPGTDPFDLGLSVMVMEHVEDDLGFVRKLASFVRPGGHVVLGVPGRRDRWNFEDEVVGHVRRYDRPDLERVLREAGLEAPEVWSVSVPIANILFRLGALMVRRGTDRAVEHQSRLRQTESSGIRRIPFKTVFPPWCRVLLNRHVMLPFLVAQRFFYHTDLGLTLIGSGRVSTGASTPATEHDPYNDQQRTHQPRPGERFMEDQDT